MATKKTAQNYDMPTKVVSKTSKARVSYPHVFKPTSVAPDKPDTLKYSCSLMIPKSDKALYRMLKAAQQAAIEWGVDNIKEWGGAVSKKLKLAIKDGDTDFDKNPEYEGHWIISAKSDRKPTVINTENEPLTKDDEFYPGCWARFSIKFFAYGKVGKGISIQLNHLQKVKDDERFGAQIASADEDFDQDWEDDGDDDGLID